MRFKGTFIACLIFVLLVAYLAVFETKMLTTDEKKKIEKRVVSFSEDTIVKLTIQSEETEIVCEKKENDIWWLSKPLMYKADMARIRRILSEITRAQIVRHLSGQEIKDQENTDTEYGLSKPRFSITMNDTSNKSVLITIGGETAVGDDVYMRVSDKQGIIIAPRQIVSALTIDVTELRDKAVFTAQFYQLNELIVHNQTTDIQLKKEQDQWMCVSPQQCIADAQTIQKLFADLTGLRAESFVDNAVDMKQYGLDPAVVTVTVPGGSVLSFGNIVPDKPSRVYAKMSDNAAVFIVEGALLTQLKDITVEKIRNKKALLFNQYLVDECMLKGDIEGTGTPVDIQLLKKDEMWQLKEQSSGYADKVMLSKVDDIVKKLAEVSIERYIDDPADAATYGLDAPRLEIVLGKDGLLLGKNTDDNNQLVYAKQKNRPEVFLVKAAVRDILKDLFKQDIPQSVIPESAQGVAGGFPGMDDAD